MKTIYERRLGTIWFCQFEEHDDNTVTIHRLSSIEEHPLHTWKEFEVGKGWRTDFITGDVIEVEGKKVRNSRHVFSYL